MDDVKKVTDETNMSNDGNINNNVQLPQNTQPEKMPNNEDVLDPESENESKKKQSLDTEKSERTGSETEDILDPEAESEKEGKSNKKRRENKDESESKDDNTPREKDAKLDETTDVGSKSNPQGTSADTSSMSNVASNSTGASGTSGTVVGEGASTTGATSASGATAGGTAVGGTTTGSATAGATASGTATGTTAGGTVTAGSATAGGAAAGGTAGSAATTAGGATALGPILIGILIAIVIIGIVSFLFNMPGLMVGKIKEFVQDLWDGFQSGFITESDAFINDDDILKLAQYIEDMDYNLLGYGFIRPSDEDYKTYIELEEMGYSLIDGIYIDSYKGVYNRYYYNVNGDIVDNYTGEVVDKWYQDEYGVRYWAKDGEKDGVNYTKDQIYSLDNIDTSLLRMYLMSDHRITVLRNDDEGLTEDFWKAVMRAMGGSPNSWSKGLIKLYKRDSDGVESLWSGLGTLWWENTDITDSGKMLSIRTGYFNRPMKFELDGWTGRYGLSLEFLLSLHLGTMAPDLVTAMVQCFDTEVQVYCEKVNDSKVLTKYKDYFLEEHEEKLENHSEEVTIEEINEILDEAGYWTGVQDGTLIEWVNGLSITKKKALKILRETGLSSPPGCVYTAMAYVVKYMQTQGTSEWPGSIAVTASEDDYYLNFFYGVYDSVLDEFEYKEDPLKDWYYTAHNSLYSVRNDKGKGWEGNTETVETEIESGLNDYVYPDRDGAIEAAKEYQIPSDLSLEPIVEKNFVGTSVDSSKAKEKDGYIVVNGYVYRIQRELISLDWSLYGYLDEENEFVIGTEEDFNTDRDDLPWEETTAYLNSYIYKIYQSGIEEDGEIILYGDSKTTSRGDLIFSIPITHIRKYGTEVVEEINDVIKVYYDDTISTERMAKFRFFNEAGDELQLLDNEYYPTSDIVSVSFIQYFDEPDYFSKGSVTIIYDEDSKTYTAYTGVQDISPSVNIVLEEKYAEISEPEEFVLNGGMNSIKDEFLYDVLYLNFVVRDKTIMELVQCGILIEDENGNYVLNEDAGKCSIPVTEGNDIDKCCSVCQRYVKRVIKGLAQVQDTDYAYYQPYIARVVGSWFRDTYFVIPENIDGALEDYYEDEDDVPIGAYGTGGSYIRVDEEYLNSSGEYWTEYVMKEIRLEYDDGNPVLDENGLEQFVETDEYQLFYLEPDGSTSDITLEKWLEEEHEVKNNLNDEETILKKYMSKEEAEQDGHVFVKKVKYQDIEQIKENTQKTDDDSGGRDLDEAPYMDGMVWSAYTIGDGGDTGWIKIEKGEVDNIDKALEMVEDKGEFYYKLLSVKSIEQEEDAIRTETNITVKNLFRYRQFYIYDGSETRAQAIENDRQLVKTMIIDYWENGSDGYDKRDAILDLSLYGRYALREAYGNDTLEIFTDDDDIAESWLEYQLDMYYRDRNEESMTSAEKARFKLDELCEFGINNTYITEAGDEVTYLDKEYYTSNNHSLDPRNRNLISVVNISKSSLDAFSILENINTLDADYQYRDFKELIVELDYFDKEDLSDAIEEVFTWILPTYTSVWPILSVDKQELEYGTLVHSQETIDFLIEVYEMLVEEERLLSSEEEDEEIEEEETGDKVDMSKVYYIGDSWFEAMRDGKLTGSADDYFTVAGGKCAGATEFNNIQVKSDASAIVIMLGLNDPTTQEQMKTLLGDLSTRYSEKDIYVLKVFPVGRKYIDSDKYNENIKKYNEDIAEYCTTKSNLKFVDATEGIVDDDGYLSSDKEANDGCHLVSYSELYSNIKEIVESSSAKAKTKNEQTLDQLKDATAYAEGDAVISPVTGKIISYGEHKRINVYTQEYETVGYIELEIMGFGEDKNNSSDSYFTKEMLADLSLTDKEKEEAVKGLNAFYDEYKNQNAGHILMIDGIDITDLKNGFSSVIDSEGNSVEYEELCKYKSDSIVALYNSKEQKRRENEAEAKENAPFLIKYNANYEEVEGEYNAPDGLSGYYVKEGAYLGKVQTSTDRTGEKPNINAGVQKENPNLDESSDLVNDNPEKTVDIRKAYDKFLETKNPSYIRIIMIDTKSTYIDNVEDYFPGMEYGSGIAVVDQEYVAQSNDLQILANLIHYEGCGSGFSKIFGGDTEMGNIASRVTGYVCLNRAIINYGNHGTTISEQIAAPGQYETKDKVLGGANDVDCSICLANAEWCLKYDCSSVQNPEGEPMPRDVTGQSGWCQCNGTKFDCWWWIDTTGDGKPTEAVVEDDGTVKKPYDTFYCK